MSQFAIGILARETHVNIETIRYYEREGVLPEPARSPSGYRQYSPEDVKRLHFIRLAKEHGFSLSEIRELLNLRVDPSTTCNMVRHKAEVKIRTIEKKIRELERMHTAITDLVERCHGEGPRGSCPILDAFEQEE